jgi:cytoskeletal protein CcmA (bactofilin family)
MQLFGQGRKDDVPPRAEPRVEPRVERSEPAHEVPEPGAEPAPEPRSDPPVERRPLFPSILSARRVEDTPMVISSAKDSESIVSAGITIEGKIEGDGNVRLVGRFKGNVDVRGELTIEPGASVDGEVKAETILVGGEVRGHIIASDRVEFKESGTLIGDVKAASLTVAAGSKMRGKVEFGWKDGEGQLPFADDLEPSRYGAGGR